MSEELLINVSPMESRVAILNDGVLSELYIERHNKMGLVGNIYVGTVVRVLPGMQAAFVDIGQSRTAFLHVNDMQKINKEVEEPNPSSQKSLNHIQPISHKSTPTENNQLTENSFFEVNEEKQAGHFSDKRLKQNYHSYQSNAIHSAIMANDRKIAQFPPFPTVALPLTKSTELIKQSVKTNKLVLAQTPKSQLDVKAPHIHQSLLTDSTTRIENTDGENKTNKSIQNASKSPNQTSILLETNSLKLDKDESNIEVNLSKDETIQPYISEVRETELAAPSFRVLSTVTETLRKDTLNPQNNDTTHPQLDSLVEEHDGNSHKDNSYAKSNSSSKRQTQINPEELIQNRLREGQQILVQVTKDQLGTKGARLTTNISLPSRYLVYIPSADNIGVSQRIDNNEERQRLRNEISALMQTADLRGGVIARTAAENISSQKLEEDIYYLLQLWRTIQARQKKVYAHQSSLMVYQELSLPLRSIRDLVHEGTERVLVDEANTYEYLKQFAQEFVPMIYPRIVPYHSQQPMFDVFRVEEDLRDALKRRVDLKSGGYLIIDQTEAMTTIDVNTGSYVGGRSLEDTVYKTNLEATHSIARQLRLRNLGGIIILDFIDMQEQEHRDDVLISLQTQLAEDYARTNITQVSELGLVEMTRKRTRESLEQQLCEPCPTCQGKGFIKTAETVCFEIFREIMRCARTYNAPKQFTVVAHASVIDLLLTSEADTVADLEYLLGRVITFEVESLYTQEQYDIVLD